MGIANEVHWFVLMDHSYHHGLPTSWLAEVVVDDVLVVKLANEDWGVTVVAVDELESSESLAKSME